MVLWLISDFRLGLVVWGLFVYVSFWFCCCVIWLIWWLLCWVYYADVCCLL